MQKLTSTGFDYVDADIVFKIKKVLRYISLFGLSRTITKVRGQYHMRKKFKTLPKISISNKSKKNVAIVGCGNFAFSNIGFYLKKTYGNVIRATMDINIDRAASMYLQYKADYYTSNIEEILQDKNIELVYISSNHASHADYAIEAIKRGKAVHIEKPHAVNFSQLDKLTKVINENNDFRINLGFNRPSSNFGNIIFDKLKNEKGSSMINWFVAGHAIDENHWYYKDEEGGRILGNLCHWTDFSYQMIDNQNKYPIKIIPVRSEKKDHDIVVNYVFGDGSISSISFSAKGHVFEGVVEKLEIQKGNHLISLDNFGTLVIHNNDKKNVFSKKRNHGHKNNIIKSYKMIKNPEISLDKEYIYNTAELFLKTKESIENNKIITINK